jgi:hypothetical protein
MSTLRPAPDTDAETPRPLALAFGLGQIVGPVFAGIVYDLIGTFLVPSLTAVSAFLVGALLPVGGRLHADMVSGVWRPFSGTVKTIYGLHRWRKAANVHLADGFVKVPAVGTQKNSNVSQFRLVQLEEIKLQDGIRLHDNTNDIIRRHENLPSSAPLLQDDVQQSIVRQNDAGAWLPHLPRGQAMIAARGQP